MTFHPQFATISPLTPKTFFARPSITPTRNIGTTRGKRRLHSESLGARSSGPTRRWAMSGSRATKLSKLQALLLRRCLCGAASYGVPECAPLDRILPAAFLGSQSDRGKQTRGGRDGKHCNQRRDYKLVNPHVHGIERPAAECRPKRALFRTESSLYQLRRARVAFRARNAHTSGASQLAPLRRLRALSSSRMT